MGYFLGIDVGAARTVAAVARAGSDDVEIVPLGDEGGPADPDGADPESDNPDSDNPHGDNPDSDNPDSDNPDSSDLDGDGIASVLHLGADGVLAVGAAAQEWAAREPDRVVHGFPGRIGEDAMLLAGEPWAPEELTAWLVRWVVDRVAEREGGPATRVAVSHPASWDADRTQLLADAVAEQELEVSFLAPSPDTAPADDPGADHDAADNADNADAVGRRGAGAPAARAAAHALRAAAAVASSVPPAPRSVDGTGSGRHAAIGAVAVPRATATGTVGGLHDRDPGPGTDAEPDIEPDAGSAAAEHADGPADVAGPASAVDAGLDDRDNRDGDNRDGDTGESDGGDGEDRDGDGADRDGWDRDGGWDVPAPRRPEPSGPEPHPADPATKNLVADLVGFTGGMGATNTAGLLSGYTPPHGMPAQWSGGHTAAGTTMTATGGAVALPAQRADSGRWGAVAPAEDAQPGPVAAPRGRNNPRVLVGAGGLAAAVAVVATLFLWPAPRTTNSAVRPVAAVPAASAVEPTPTVSLTTTPEPVPTHRPRPAPPRTRRPVVPPVTAATEPTDTTAPPTESTEPTEPSTSPPSTEPTEPTTTTKHHDN